MSDFYIYSWDDPRRWTALGKFSELEATYRAYKKACELTAIFNKTCAIIDGNTGEIIAISDEENE